MTTFKFETINTDVPSNPEDVGYALIGAFAALASTVVGDDQEKQAELFHKMDKALEYNKETTSYIELARIAQITKAALSGKQ
ncbi:hypothetical protein [Klebsiella aerogenes]|uniref:hypothetical protein n=1 Tax=Klebsiella aerogenes TaxID=548 RepID=UPI0013D370AF|nr:hypothetical protein [Klebsiella aerogenes]